MHEFMMAHTGMNHEHHATHDNAYGNHEGWSDLSHQYTTPQHQSPMYEQGGFNFMQSPLQSNGNEQSYIPPPQPVSQPPPLPTTHHQQLLPLVMPNNPTWPSMLTNPAKYSAPPVAIPPALAPIIKGNGGKLPSVHTMTTPRKTLTDNDRRRMCQYHEDNPSIKQTEIGAMFGVERSTVSKVLRQREKYLFPEDRSLSPVKRAKGKFPDIERALSNWVRNQQKQGHPLSDSAIKEKARYFATTVGNNENHLKTNSSSWLEKFKQKNGIGGARLLRRASETNISDSGSLAPDSVCDSASQTPNGLSPTTTSGLPSPSPLSGAKSNDDLKSESINGYFGHENSTYGHSNSQSTTSLSSVFTDSNNANAFSGQITSPAQFSFSPDSSGWMPDLQGRPELCGTNFQRPRSQTFPMLGLDPSFSSQSDDLPTPKYNITNTEPPSALASPLHEMGPPFGIDSTIASPPLHHSSSNGSMAPPSTGTSITGLQSPPGSVPSSPTQDDARRALDLVLSFFSQAPNGLVDQNEYNTVLKLTEKLRLTSPLPGGLHRIAEDNCELMAPKIEQSMNPGY